MAEPPIVLSVVTNGALILETNHKKTVYFTWQEALNILLQTRLADIR